MPYSRVEIKKFEPDGSELRSMRRLLVLPRFASQVRLLSEINVMVHFKSFAGGSGKLLFRPDSFLNMSPVAFSVTRNSLLKRNAVSMLSYMFPISATFGDALMNEKEKMEFNTKTMVSVESAVDIKLLVPKSTRHGGLVACNVTGW